MADVKQNNWYVLYTAPRAEKQVQSRVDALGVECWLPLHRSPRVWSDRVKIVGLAKRIEEIFFPGDPTTY